MGRGVDHTNLICADAVEDVCRVIADYIARYEEMGAERVMAIATSAVREAANGEAFIAELRERFALDTRLLTGEEEAHLTYLGATAHRAEGEPTLVFDIGGGSTELIVGTGMDVGFHTSLQAGTIRQSERHLTSDPPDPHELEDLASEVRNLIDGAVAEQPAAAPTRAIAVAGTPTSSPRSTRPSSRMTPAGSTATAWACGRSSGCSAGSPRCRSPSVCAYPGFIRGGHRRSLPGR